MAAALVILLVLLSEAASDLSVVDFDVVHVKPGDDVTLPCRAVGVSIRVVEWTREDLEDKSVLLYRDGQTDPGGQNPSFRDRVQLSDSELKDGDVSLLLKNVNINDAGTYECGVASGGSRQKRAAAEKIKLMRRIQLEVSDVVQVKPGDDVTLPCRADGDIRAVKWTREDLEDKYVLLYRDGQTDPDSQDPSFRDRVQLFDRKLKDGDVSLILRNVNINDTGTYVCGVSSDDSERDIRQHIIRINRLEVSGSYSSPPPDGNVGVGGVGVVVLVCSAVGLFLV